MNTARMLVAACAGLGLAPTTSGQSVPSYGHDLVTIGDPGNVPIDLGGQQFDGRGRVDYQYRIGRMEVTTAQWMEYVNTFSARPGGAGFTDPWRWGAELDRSYTGPGERWKLRDVPDAGMLPVTGINWREAARYANWLHNDQSPEPWAIENGAYDASTFSTNPNGTYNDQLTRSPGARFWIPSLDEWLKAVHYDPNRHGGGQGGWWLYPNSSDSQPAPGPPGVGQSSAGWQDPVTRFGEWLIPLGAYAEEVTPWGLLDASGGATEWTESDFSNNRMWRWTDGENAGGDEIFYDYIGYAEIYLPSFFANGLRIASVVPAPATGVVALGILFLSFSRRRQAPLTSKERGAHLTSPRRTR